MGYDEVDSTNALTSPNFWKSMGLNLVGTANTPMMGIPAAAWRKFALTKQGQDAVDEVRRMVEERKNWVQKALEIGALNLPGAGLLMKGGTTLSKMGRGAAAGAGALGTLGYLESKEGEELGGTAKGVAIGAGIGAALPAAFALGKGGLGIGRKVLGYPEPKTALQIEKEAAESFERNINGETGLRAAASEVFNNPELLLNREAMIGLGRRYASNIDEIITQDELKELRRLAAKRMDPDMRGAIVRKGEDGAALTEEQLLKKKQAFAMREDLST
jgi:hypothetical protein